MEVIIQPDPASASRVAAQILLALVTRKPNAVLGLATGGTPLALYRELITAHKDRGFDFSRVTTFNLDEYIGLPENHPQSYHAFMHENLFRHINIQPDRIHIPNGNAPDIQAHCLAYEEAIRNAGGLDLQLLGIGSDGHIGFNEPTSSLGSRTRTKTLTRQTIEDNARFFENDPNQVPQHCITMGIATILEARCALLLAFGKGKADAIAATIEGPLSAMIPASALQLHPNAIIIIDQDAAAKLTLADYYKEADAAKPTWQQDHATAP
ncbi:MAG: glucosamine-6-phosphate deaminase [Kiritimatiellae bacterium]|nr:glucosamine-6-phosphate deaminase [Kiritimatiellia bacterium]